MCLRRNDFRPGAQDVLLGEVEGCLFYVGAAQYAYWAPYRIVVDVTGGGGDSFSLEAADGVRFHGSVAAVNERGNSDAREVRNGGRSRLDDRKFARFLTLGPPIRAEARHPQNEGRRVCDVRLLRHPPHAACATTDLKRRMARPKNKPPINATRTNWGHTTSIPAPR